MAAAGAAEDTVKQAGQWKSDVVNSYINHDEVDKALQQRLETKPAAAEEQSTSSSSSSDSADGSLSL